MTKYYRDCDREGIQFFPIVVEALGGWHRDAEAAVSKPLAGRRRRPPDTCSRD